MPLGRKLISSSSSCTPVIFFGKSWLYDLSNEYLFLASSP